MNNSLLNLNVGEVLIINKNIKGRIDELDYKHYRDNGIEKRLKKTRIESYAGKEVIVNISRINCDGEIYVTLPSGRSVYLPSFILRRPRKNEKV